MISSGSQGRMALVALVLIAVVHSGSAEAEKLASCCKTVSTQEITESISGYLVQKASRGCVNAIVFQTKSGLFCSQVRAPWVRRKIVAFEKSKAQASASPPASVEPSPVSLLSILTSTITPPPPSSPLSPSAPPPSSPPSTAFSSTPGDTLSENDYE